MNGRFIWKLAESIKISSESLVKATEQCAKGKISFNEFNQISDRFVNIYTEIVPFMRNRIKVESIDYKGIFNGRYI